MAVTVGFEPTVGGYPTQLFESCTFGRSDTSPRTSLVKLDQPRQSSQSLLRRRRSTNTTTSAPVTSRPAANAIGAMVVTPALANLEPDAEMGTH